MSTWPSLICDGRVSAADEPVFHADDRGLRHGDGAFETMRCADGAVIALERHLARLADTLTHLAIGPLEPARLRAEAARLIQVNGLERGEAIVRLTVTSGRGAGPRRGPCTAPTVVWTAARPGPRVAAMRAGVDLLTRPDPPRAFAGHKTLAYLAHVVAGRDGHVLYARAGRAWEGPGWNLFARVDGRWTTAPADGSILPGVARAVVLDLAPEIARVAPPIAAIEAAFISNAVLPLAPVRSIDGRALAAPEPLDRLRAGFAEAA